MVVLSSGCTSKGLNASLATFYRLSGPLPSLPCPWEDLVTSVVALSNIPNVFDF